MERDKHTCLNCRFYQKGSHYDCKENIEEQVVCKDRPNFCDFFVAKENNNSEAGGSSLLSSHEDAEALFNSFFRD